tara:strand:+ start:4168 stop:5127 length:960 start_codon:yes stop_codon:yes gene_type:complete
MKTKFAIGCLVQWYEIKIIKEYVDSLIDALDYHDNDNIIVDFTLSLNQDLEKIEGASLEEIKKEYDEAIMELIGKCSLRTYTATEILSIADYRRDFNNKYCEKVDVLVWGESDMLAPKQMFTILDNLHQQVKDKNPKYLGFFSGCKMWDDSWKDLEHPDFTDKPFIEGDTENWWSLRYTMSKDEMNKINDKTDELDVRVLPQHKFNGCGLIISSEVIKSGANIPKGMFFVHEDTAFMHMTNKILGNIPQYVINNILLVHNRKHHNKRYKVKGEEGINPTDTGTLRDQHSWYRKAYEYSTQNLNNLFNPNYKFKTWKDVL